QEELNSLTALVKQAVGYDASRGDQVTVTNIAFHGNAEIAPPPLPLWQQPWVWQLGKYLIALMVILVLVFGVLRPALRAFLPPPETEPEAEEGGEEGAAAAEAGEGAAGAVGEDGEPLSLEEESEALLLLEGPQSYEKRLEFVRRLIDEDPDRVVQVIKNWIAEDGGN
ncbi:MAG TPA: flagellar M-ring protein FliF, partial [Bryobacterales bacterium]|nr:flagellar M-ring protein FliF [Bryobacterales bacterium]